MKKAGILLSLVPYKKLKKILGALLDENEFLSPGGIRSLSKIHQNPYKIIIDGKEFGVSTINRAIQIPIYLEATLTGVGLFGCR